MGDSYFAEALKKLVEVGEAQEKHWSELPKMLDRSAANFALKANEATVSAVKPMSAVLDELRDELYKQHSLLAAMKEETAALARDSSFHARDLKELKKELASVKARVLVAEEWIRNQETT